MATVFPEYEELGLLGMKHFFRLGSIILRDKVVKSRVKKAGGGAVYVEELHQYAGKNLLDLNETSALLMRKIQTGSPFCASRLGANELFSMGMFEFDVKSKQQKALEQLNLWSGFFPTDTGLGDRFNSCYKESCGLIDLIGISAPRFEEYYIKRFMPSDVQITRIFDLEPWRNPSQPWTAALRGKKVLVIHPFSDTIQRQYNKREALFPGTEILPEFELKILKAVQTAAGEEDSRFGNWFEALDWMHAEAMKIDFDVAIIGCGAYGLPLAAKLKSSGKQAIHLGGPTQILFGIKGKRWEENKAFAYVQKYFNDAWVYPSDADRPKQASKVEDGCYW